MINISMPTFFFTILNILVLFVGLKLFLFKPIMDVINKREEMVQAQFANAKNAEDEAMNLKKDYQEKLRDASQTAEQMVNEAKGRAELERDKMLAEARMESEKMLDKAKADIAAEQRRAEDSVRDEISKLAIAAARKIIKTGDQSDAGSN